VAQLVFNIPNAALAVLDAYAQQKQFADFHEYTRHWMKNSYRNARREKNRQDAADLVAQEPPDPTIT
jgi:TfoX/Sxy family transcriptional regulator of competence genes